MYQDIVMNLEIKKQGIHHPDKEFEVFKMLLQRSKNRRIILDSRLQKLIE